MQQGKEQPFNKLGAGGLMVSWLLVLAVWLLPQAALAQTFPELTGRVVDAANIIPPDEEARLDQKLAALETQSHRQLVVATIPDLQGYDIADYGYQLGRHWGIGSKDRNDGALLIIAPKERRVRIEVGYGLEGTLTDGLSSLIIQQQIVPKFKASDMPGGIEAGTDAIIHQLQLPPDQAQQVAAQAQAQAKSAKVRGISASTVVWLLFFFLFFVLPLLRRTVGGRGYGSSGLGQVILWSALDSMTRGGRGDGWGGGGGWSGGGFSGGSCSW